MVFTLHSNEANAVILMAEFEVLIRFIFRWYWRQRLAVGLPDISYHSEEEFLWKSRLSWL